MQHTHLGSWDGEVLTGRMRSTVICGLSEGNGVELVAGGRSRLGAEPGRRPTFTWCSRRHRSEED
jgi:hypothetical protein